MKAGKVYNDFLGNAKYWLKELEYYGKNQFKQKVEGEVWTIGELYDFLMNGSYELHFEAIRNCLKKTNGEVKGKKTFIGSIVFSMGSYLPVRIKSAEYSPYQPQQLENPEKTKDMLYRFIKEMQKLSVDIDTAGGNDYAVKHPKFGYLTAIEWYKVIEMQFKYYLRNKKRMDNSIRSYTKEKSSEEFIDDLH